MKKASQLLKSRRGSGEIVGFLIVLTVCALLSVAYMKETKKPLRNAFSNIATEYSTADTVVVEE